MQASDPRPLGTSTYWAKLENTAMAMARKMARSITQASVRRPMTAVTSRPVAGDPYVWYWGTSVTGPVYHLPSSPAAVRRRNRFRSR